MRRARVLAILGLLLVAAPAAPAADLRQVESVGVVPILRDGSQRQAPRDAALDAAVARGVEGVAQSILPAGWQEALAPDTTRSAPPGEIEARLAPALGKDPFEYATRYRILEDRGVRAALLTRNPEAETEYVVVVEVYVDAGRLRERFEAAGWIQPGPDGGNGPTVRVVLQDLASFGAYDAFRRSLLDELGVDSALPVDLARGRAVLAVRGPYDAEGLQQALVRHSGVDGLRVVPLSREGDTLTLLVDYTPPAAPARDEADSESPDLAPPD
ncbi:MAG: hypothetical protein ACQGVC_02205 [Myxococcota bacterium]